MVFEIFKQFRVFNHIRTCKSRKKACLFEVCDKVRLNSTWQFATVLDIGFNKLILAANIKGAGHLRACRIMSLVVRKAAFCICENKAAQIISFAELISAVVFATRIVQSLFFLNPEFQASSHLLWLYSPVYVGPGQKPEDRFSQNEAHMA